MKNSASSRGFKPLIALAAAVCLCLTLVLAQGCGGGGATSTTNAKTTTTGQELIDLQKAYDQGVITTKQYEEQKKKILKGD